MDKKEKGILIEALENLNKSAEDYQARKAISLEDAEKYYDRLVKARYNLTQVEKKFNVK